MNIDEIIMKRLEAQRKKLDMKNEEFAAFLGLKDRTYRKYKEDGCKLSHEELYNVSVKLGCSIDYLYGIDDQEEREVADVCKVTGLSAEAVKQLRVMKDLSRCHGWGYEDDPGYIAKALLGLLSYVIANGYKGHYYGYLLNASAKRFYQVVNNLPESDEIRNRVGADLDALIWNDNEYNKYQITKDINNLLDEYEPQIPACSFSALRGFTFGQKANWYGEDNEKFAQAYQRIKGLSEYEMKLVNDKPKSIEVKKKPTAKDWELFKEITGLTKEDLPGYKEGESNEKR